MIDVIHYSILFYIYKRDLNIFDQNSMPFLSAYIILKIHDTNKKERNVYFKKGNLI